MMNSYLNCLYFMCGHYKNKSLLYRYFSYFLKIRLIFLMTETLIPHKLNLEIFHIIRYVKQLLTSVKTGNQLFLFRLTIFSVHQHKKCQHSFSKEHHICESSFYIFYSIRSNPMLCVY